MTEQDTPRIVRNAAGTFVSPSGDLPVDPSITEHNKLREHEASEKLAAFRAGIARLAINQMADNVQLFSREQRVAQFTTAAAELMDEFKKDIGDNSVCLEQAAKSVATVTNEIR